ncbi:MAG TPA: hypothetical protein VL128_16335 [Candidatus Eisenbacteria bacterium]|nr:hypothetical protein [Candidatus Eisenbacteria bacterium]
MVETEKQSGQPEKLRQEFLSSAAPWTDTISKAVAAIVVALYACGFLIVSIYHSRFGFVGTNPFRPRVLAAGAWFFFFVGIPVSVTVNGKSRSWREIARNSTLLWIVSYSGSIPLGYLLFDSTASYPIHLRLWFWIALTGLWALLLVATKYSKLPPWVADSASVVLTLFYVADPLRRVLLGHEFGISTVALWFFIVTLVVIQEFKIRNRENLSIDGGWSKPLVTLFGILLAFSLYIYPHLKASWGGGTPADVTIYFTKDSLLSPNKATQAQLVEETDEGFYIVGQKESKAVFVPRSAVALIYFSDKAADSPMLRGIH